MGVVRSYPIRVAGNSGPFGKDCEEITWEEVTRRAGSPTPIAETTTVTGLPRRVSTFSWSEFERARQVNRPTELAFTFADYLDWAVHSRPAITDPIEEFIERLEAVAECPVTLVQTGPHTTNNLDHYRRSILRRVR